jgi:hypothetical protein
VRTLMRLRIHREVDQKRKMFAGAKANSLAVGSEECRMTQAAEIPSRLHRVSLVTGDFRVCGGINSPSTRNS